MKFSYNLLKKIYPKIKDKKKVESDLMNHSFEVDGVQGDMIDISILPNRYNDASGHIGIAKELSVANGREFKYVFKGLQKKGSLDIEIKDKMCSRYMGALVELKVSKTPKYILDALKTCEINSINGVVDVMNYVMLLTGQPMHAFDYDKIEGKVVVKRVEKETEVITLDDNKVKVPKGALVIADDNGVLAIAGIKGGKRAEVDKNTKRILVEAASFDRTNVFKTSKKINLNTDASLRFSHDLHPDLAEMGMVEALELLKKEFKGSIKAVKDINFYKEKQNIISFDVERFKSFIGIDLSEKEIVKVFSLLEFKVEKNKGKLNIHVPSLRVDIETEEDLFEEVVRVVGIDKIKPEPPVIAIYDSHMDDTLSLRGKVTDILNGFSLDEVYTYSFNSEKGVALKNSISSEKEFLRSDLTVNLERVVLDNFRFFDEVNIFEIGRVFVEEKNKFFETYHLGVAIGNKKGDSFKFLRGVLDGLFKKLGLTDFYFDQDREKLVIYVDGKIIGVAYKNKDISIAEINFFNLVESVTYEKSFEPIVKYPSVVRDVSVLVPLEVRIGDMVRKIQMIDVRDIVDVDMIDFYDGKKLPEGMKSITFRVVMQSDKKSITSKEADSIMNKISKLLEKDFGGEIR